ncbi:GH3 auxin-responsive promoter family protein [Ascidiimonas sp. W6]|uniref:GH3 family domain-containing protein n=1 Tax=Ascidiimonas meishanensis TaxID=3128903 RepID=UPI0030ECC292
MAIIGSLIKGFIEAKDLFTRQTDHVEAQQKVLKELLEKASETQFGKHYNFSKILKSDKVEKAFATKVPYFDYHRINDAWWKKLHEGETDVTWPGSPDYYALSSGTTGKKSKRIPVTEEMIASIRRAGIKQVFALSNFDLPADFFEKEIMMLGSSTDLIEKEDHLEGEISGISASNIPEWFSGYYKPGKEIAKIGDWDQRVEKIAKKASDWDIGALSGIPSWMELMLQKVIEYHNLKNIHEIWPNLQVYTSGGVAFDPYKKSFNTLMGKPITLIDTYLASEGFIAFQKRPETDAMQLVTDNGIYFEFVPFKPEYIKSDGSLSAEAPSLTIEEVTTDEDYVLIISTVSGAWRYLIGDTIAFTDVDRAEIKITGRTKFFLNTVGSQLSVNKLNDAIQHLENEMDMEISEYTLCAKRYGEDFYHSWYIGTTTKLEEKHVAEILDAFLKDANKNYRVARSKALEGVKVKLIAPSIFHEWSGANKKKGGQVKMERVMGEEKFKEWEEFVAQNS